MASMTFEFQISDPLQRNLTSVSRNRKTPVLKTQQDEFVTESTKCRYRTDVLVGNWFNRKSTYVPPSNDWLTIYETAYTCKSNPAFKKDRIALNDNKLRSERGLGSEFLIKMKGDGSYNNYTTTKDLSFRIIPKGLCDANLRRYNSKKNQWLPAIDLTKNFGNLTQYSLNAKSELNDGHIQTRRFKPKGEMNEPYLNHLDIDPNLPFRPLLIKVVA